MTSASEITPGLWVGDLEAANNAALLKELKVTSLLSVGCTCESACLFDEEHRLAFPEPLDLPETLLGSILPVSNAWLEKQAAAGEVVLVHCRYGQSRSVALVVAHLLCSSRIDDSPDATLRLDRTLAHVTACRPSLCINPGFLAQLHMVAVLGRGSLDFAEMRLMQCAEGTEGPRAEKEGAEAAGDKAEASRKRARVAAPTRPAIVCRQCRALLAGADDEVRATAPTYTAALAVFVEAHLLRDPFWKGYRRPTTSSTTATGSSSSSSGKKGGGDEVLTGPVDWMQRQARERGAEGRADLACPACERRCGAWQRGGLGICHGYLQVDRFALYGRDAARIERIDAS